MCKLSGSQNFLSGIAQAMRWVHIMNNLMLSFIDDRKKLIAKYAEWKEVRLTEQEGKQLLN